MFLTPLPHSSHHRFDDSSNSADDHEDSSGQEGSLPPSAKGEKLSNGLRDNLQALYPTIEAKTIDEIFPSRWESEPSHRIKIATDGLKVSCRQFGPPDQRHGYSGVYVRTLTPIPRKCGVYYFEITCVKNDGGHIAIGFIRLRREHERTPDKAFHGYQGYDGNFVSHSNNNEYGPRYGTNDVIGCYVDFIGRNVSFCRNGIKMGNVPYRMEPRELLYPAIYVQGEGESIEANFGQKPFEYDFKKDIKAMRENVLEGIRSLHLPSEKVDGIRRMISSYLQCEGYVKTVEAFCKATNLESEEDISSVKQRREIIEAILSRNSETGFLKTEEYFPLVLQSQPVPLLFLKTQQFVELAWRNAEILYLRKKESQMLREAGANGNSATPARHSMPSSSNCLSPEAASDQPTSARSSMTSPLSGQKRPHSRSSQQSGPSRRAARHHSSSGNGNVPLELTDLADDDCCKNGNGVAAASNEADESDQSAANGAASNGVCNPEIEEDVAEYTSEDVNRIEKLLSLGQEINQIATERGHDLTEELLVFADQALGLLCKPRRFFRGHSFLSQRHLRRVARQVNAYLLDPAFGESGSTLDAMIGSLELKKQELIEKDCPSMLFIDVSEILYGFPGPLPDSDDEEFYSSCTDSSDSEYDESDSDSEDIESAESAAASEEDTGEESGKEDTPMEDPNVPCSSHSVC